MQAVENEIVFDEKATIGKYCELPGNARRLLRDISSHVPVTHLAGVSFIFRPLEDLGEPSTLAWKYTYRKYKNSLSLEGEG